MKIGICNVGIGGAYALGSTRLKESLIHHNINWERYIWINKYPDGCPTHQQQPYAFKLYAMKNAIEQGCDIIIWADYAVWAINNRVDELIEYIDKKGYYFLNSGYSIGQWTSDLALNEMGYERDDEIHDTTKSLMIMACFYAIDLRKPIMRQFYDEVIEWSLKDGGKLLKGDWKNDNHQVSSDDRCTGHRHDQSIISVLIKKYGFEITNGHENFFSYFPIGDHYVGRNINNLGNAVEKIKDTVCFLTQGMDGREGLKI